MVILNVYLANGFIAVEVMIGLFMLVMKSDQRNFIINDSLIGEKEFIGEVEIPDLTIGPLIKACNLRMQHQSQSDYDKDELDKLRNKVVACFLKYNQKKL